MLMLSKEQFMIDEEIVAIAPSQVQEGIEYFLEWSNEMLMKGFYTSMLDVYELDRLLTNCVPYAITTLCKHGCYLASFY